MEVLVAYLHYLSVILTGGLLVGELVLCRPGLTGEPLRLLPRLDIAYFVAALAALATGLLRLFVYSHGLGFYLPNPFFIAKLALFLTIAGISVAPTVRFVRWARAASSGLPPPSPDEIRAVRRLIHIELGLLALIPLMAVLMARGIGR